MISDTDSLASFFIDKKKKKKKKKLSTCFDYNIMSWLAFKDKSEV